ncbi:PLDc N-terminal domain-containing protein [Gillisia sp. JM1]|uniref:PLDc N-terminal domain-containing protein n=1 Tax=Gillisia sp. JM1 TaxID=1283286 RepID=UPI0004795F42|nr:PLD nuclease N-terminal domain-containing protein [Gillisia sp. JM1]
MDKLITDFSFGIFIWQALILISIALWIYCLIDVLRNKFEQNDKIMWILIVIFLPLLGSFLYLLIGKNKKIRLN